MNWNPLRRIQWEAASRTVVVVQQPPLPQAEIQGAFGVSEEQPQWRATMQVIDELERDAIGLAQASIANHGTSAGFLGGAEWLARLRARLIAHREAAMLGKSGNLSTDLHR